MVGRKVEVVLGEDGVLAAVVVGKVVVATAGKVVVGFDLGLYR